MSEFGLRIRGPDAGKRNLSQPLLSFEKGRESSIYYVVLEAARKVVAKKSAEEIADMVKRGEVHGTVLDRLLSEEAGNTELKRRLIRALCLAGNIK